MASESLTMLSSTLREGKFRYNRPGAKAHVEGLEQSRRPLAMQEARHACAIARVDCEWMGFGVRVSVSFPSGVDRLRILTRAVSWMSPTRGAEPHAPRRGMSLKSARSLPGTSISPRVSCLSMDTKARPEHAARLFRASGGFVGRSEGVFVRLTAYFVGYIDTLVRFAIVVIFSRRDPDMMELPRRHLGSSLDRGALHRNVGRARPSPSCLRKQFVVKSLKISSQRVSSGTECYRGSYEGKRRSQDRTAETFSCR